MEQPEYDSLFRSLAQIIVHQDTINDRLIAQADRTNDAISDIGVTLAHVQRTQDQMATTLARVETTMADVRTLLQRVFREEPNGHE